MSAEATKPARCETCGAHPNEFTRAEEGRMRDDLARGVLISLVAWNFPPTVIAAKAYAVADAMMAERVRERP